MSRQLDHGRHKNPPVLAPPANTISNSTLPTEFISVETGLCPTPAVHHRRIVQKPVSIEASSMGRGGSSMTSNSKFLKSGWGALHEDETAD